MLQEGLDLRAEADDLHAFLETLSEQDWQAPTSFMKWTPWDVVAHLHYFDEVSMLSMQGLEAFKPKRDFLIDAYTKGRTNAEIARAEYDGVAPQALLERWREVGEDMAAQLSDSDPKRRLPWFGPDMGVRMFTTARYMETWAHGQEVYDLKKVERPTTDRIKNIATIGVKTYGWTFVNRKQEVPGDPPYIRLTAPSGAIWEWGEVNDDARIEGAAIDFCRVVTQTRNIADTDLAVVGDVANQWMAIAQCFAGPAIDPPKPGTRG